MREWFNLAVLKTAVAAMRPWVRIPVSLPQTSNSAVRVTSGYDVSRRFESFLVYCKTRVDMQAVKAGRL